MGWPWDVLGIAQTDDKSAIRRAYADRLRAMDIDKDIQGYSNLRHARDEALWRAQNAYDEADDAPLLADDDGWDEADASRSDDADGLDDESFEQDAGESSELDDFAITWQDIQADSGNPFGYGTGGYVDPQTTVHAGSAEPQDAGGPDRDLAHLLFPDGQYSEEAFTHDEYEQARAAVAALIEDAQSGDLGREQQVDYWLGEILAETWPRSAPVVEQASTAFDWLSESGDIGERPALQFLNPRLRGMRFTDKVEQPDHPLHKAWLELKRPGKRGFMDRFRIKREEVHTLLGGIRERYPEVESYLDAERVASWEEAAPEWVSWIVQRLFILFVVVQALRFCGEALPDGQDAEQITVAPSAEQMIDREDWVRELFGEEASGEALRANDPALARRLDLLRFGSRSVGEDEAVRRGSYLTRFLVHRAVQKAPFDDLLAIHALRRDAAREVRAAQGDEACSAFLQRASVPDDFELSEEIRSRERRLAWNLVGSGWMDPDEELDGPETAPIPVWLLDDVIEGSGSTRDEVEAELTGEGGPHSCAIRLALVDAMLSRPGDLPVDLLRLR